MGKVTPIGSFVNELRIIKNKRVKSILDDIFVNKNSDNESNKILNNLLKTEESKEALHQVIDDAISNSLRSALEVIESGNDEIQFLIVNRENNKPILNDEKLSDQFDWYLNNYEHTLRAFSKRLLSKILSNFPQWKDYIKVNEYWEVMLSIPAPSPKDENDVLWLAIESESEVIIGFDEFHGHFYDYCYSSEDEFINKIIKFLKGIQNGSLIVVKEIHDDNNLEYHGIIEHNALQDYPHKILYKRAWTD